MYKNKILLFFGLLLGVLYSLFAFFFNSLGQNVAIAELTTKNISRYLLVTASLVLIYIVYFCLYQYFKSNPLTTKDGKIVWFFAVIFAVIFIFIIPVMQDDFYHYLFEDAVLVRYHLNPYLTTPMQLPGEPTGWLSYWRFLPSQHGPMRAVMMLPAAFLSGLDIVLAIFLYKIIIMLFLLGSNFLFYLVAKRINEQHSVFALLMFSWSPLILYETMISGGTDILMMFWFLLGLYLILEERYYWAIITFALSVLVKYVTIILWPFWLAYIISKKSTIKGKVAQCLKLILIFMLTVVVCFLPFWRGPEIFTGISWVASVFNQNSFPSLIVFLLSLVNINSSLIVVKIVFEITFLIFYLYLFIKFIKTKNITMEKTITYSFIVISAFLLLAKFWFFNKYLIWLLPLIFLSEKRIYPIAVFLTGFVVFSPLKFDFAYLLIPPIFVFFIYYSIANLNHAKI
ncbi:MAG: hypothetical protein M1338_05190 [Patescibacteria group bacterium]|nr:hypothetical protein [Patescibacteria group bacterium]